MSATSGGPGWWLASDGRWYPPTPATAEALHGPGAPATVAIPPPNETAGNRDALEPPAGGPAVRTSWELAEGLATVLLVASVVRFVGSVIAAAIGGYPSYYTHVERDGYLLLTAFTYADSAGVVLLLGALGLLWWQANKWSERRWVLHQQFADPLAAREVAGHLARTRRLLTLTGALFLLVALGGAAFIVGTVLSNRGVGPWRLQWRQIVATGSLELAYVAVAVAGLVAVRRILRGVRIDDHGPVA